MRARSARSRTSTLLACACLGALAVACGSDGSPGASGLSGGDSCFERLSSLNGARTLTFSASWSPVDDFALWGATDELRLLRIDTGAGALHELAAYTEQPGNQFVAFSPDGDYALSATTDVRLLRIQRDPPGIAELARFTGHAGNVYALMWSPDGRRAVTVGEDATVRVLDVDGPLGTLGEHAVFGGHVGKVYDAAWSPDGTHLVTAGQDGTLRILSVNGAGGALAEVTELAFDHLVSLAGWSPKTNDVLAGTWGPPHALGRFAFDPASGALEPLATVEAYTSGLKALAWTRSATHAVIAGHDDTPRWFSLAERGLREIAVLGDYLAGVHTLSLAPDDEHFLIAASRLDQVTLVRSRACPH